MQMLNFKPSTAVLALLVAGPLLAPDAAHAADKVVIKLGTLAPEGSEWHNALVKIGQRWKTASEGNVELKIYPGGVAGDEGDMVRKIRIGQLHAATITGIGLGTIHRSTIALQIPMLIQSWEELDYIRTKLGPELEKELDAAGFVVNSWGDAGWVHFFSTKPGKTPDDFRPMKLFVWTGDPEAERVWRHSKFTPSLWRPPRSCPRCETGMVEAFQTAPLFALTSQWYKSAKNMVKINWAPLNGATIISKKQWEKIDPKYRAELLKISREEGETLKLAVRRMSDKGHRFHGRTRARRDGARRRDHRAVAQDGGARLPRGPGQGRTGALLRRGAAARQGVPSGREALEVGAV
jgi:TRAP-type C4-dicarboxylate transport system substrate-binding protein